MNKRILYILALLLTPFLASNAAAQEETEIIVIEEDNNAEPEPLPISTERKKSIVDSIASTYKTWDTMSMSGKLSSSMFPISPSVKIYMERGKLVVISISVPLMGEVGRVEIDRKEAIAVNKYSNKYTAVDMQDLGTFCPGGLEALQDMILRRITLLGSGELKKKDADKLEIYATNYGDWLLLPNQQIETEEYIYLYLLDMASLQTDKFLVINQEGNPVGECTYSDSKNGYTLTLSAKLKGRPLEMQLKLDNADKTPKKIDRIVLGNKYKKVTPSQLFK